MAWVMSITFVAAVVATWLRSWLAVSLGGLLFVNMFGSFLAGFVAQTPRLMTSPWSQVLLVGFCGALTTFSGFALSSVKLLEEGEIFKMAANLFLHNALCLGLCYCGWVTAKRIWM
jgi:fluoride exporter